MNIKKIISQVLLLVLLVSIVSIDTHATVPSKVRVYETQSLDGGVKLRWSTISNATSYIVKRAETRLGNYTVIEDNLLENTYEDTELENAKTYYYKVIAKNAEGKGQESEIVEATPSKSNYLWIEIYGFNSSIAKLELFDEKDNKIYFDEGSFNDPTIRGSYYNWVSAIKNDGVFLNSANSNTYNSDYIPTTRIGLKLKPHIGIKKISFNGYGIRANFYETIETSYSKNPQTFGEVIFTNANNTKYEILRSGLEAQGKDKEVSLQWNSVASVKSYMIKRAEYQTGPFNVIEGNILTTRYTDKTVDNQKTYYYKVEAQDLLGNIIDLGTVSAKTTKCMFVIMELFESNNTTYNSSRLYELNILDNNDDIINYRVSQTACFNTPIDYDPESRIYKKENHYYRYGNLHDNNDTKYIGSQLGNGQWARFILKLDDNIGISKINLWTGNDYAPKKVTFFTALSYDYENNLKLRKNTNFAFFSEKTLANTGELIKYEFTQTSPNTPQGVNAISQDTRVNIKWNKVDNADSYKIKRSTSPSGPYTVIQEDIVDLQYTDTGVINGTEYYYVVSAVNKGGESNNSLEASVIPSAKLPQTPTGLTAKSQQNGINLSWNPIYNASSYTIKRSETAGGPYETILENTTDTSFSDSGLIFGTTYYYVITANNSIGISNNSEEIQGTPGQVLPEKPINIITKVKENNVYLTWDTANHAVSYNVMRSETEDGTYNVIENVKGISYKDVTAESDKTYFYKIIAVNEQGESETSEQVRVVVKDNIEQKILLSLTMKNGSTKEYVITHSQLVKFMSWYQDNTVKKGLPYFTLIAKNRYGAYKSSKKYILFDSIMAIDVKEVQSN
ncbi:fibronectin type III domain-containing protein [Vallitalea maricola]|uniref:Uncharacterized protein n=1 Tax=Vallitalea maricola TaxID=3074433 RepID=A0ACB5UDQ6_9FIRM|nr:hypothetical protein AN2V17_02350 [Vallitalea sp. AN17-2]